MDYMDLATMTRHVSWTAFLETLAPPARLVLLSTRATAPHHAFAWRPDDVLLLGRESAGVPDAVHDRADAAVRIPMAAGVRSLNVAVAASMVLDAALTATGGWPAGEDG